MQKLNCSLIYQLALEYICILKTHVTTELTIVQSKPSISCSSLSLVLPFNQWKEWMDLKWNLRYHKVYDFFILWAKKLRLREDVTWQISPRIRSLVSGFPNILFIPPLISKITYSLYHMVYHLSICFHAIVNHSLM